MCYFCFQEKRSSIPDRQNPRKRRRRRKKDDRLPIKTSKKSESGFSGISGFPGFGGTLTNIFSPAESLASGSLSFDSGISSQVGILISKTNTKSNFIFWKALILHSNWFTNICLLQNKYLLKSRMKANMLYKLCRMISRYCTCVFDWELLST